MWCALKFYTENLKLYWFSSVYAMRTNSVSNLQTVCILNALNSKEKYFLFFSHRGDRYMSWFCKNTPILFQNTLFEIWNTPRADLGYPGLDTDGGQMLSRFWHTPFWLVHQKIKCEWLLQNWEISWVQERTIKVMLEWKTKVEAAAGCSNSEAVWHTFLLGVIHCYSVCYVHGWPTSSLFK